MIALGSMFYLRITQYVYWVTGASLVVMGKHASAWGVRDCSRYHVFRWGPLIGLRSAARLKTRQMGSPRGSIGGRTCFKI